VDPDSTGIVAGSTGYGMSFCCVLARGSLVGTLFLPEMSGSLGLRVFANFLRMAGDNSRQKY